MKQNGTLVRTLLLSVCLILLTQCKKGEDDPAFTLRTRKARVVGDWKATKGKSSYADEGPAFKNSSEIIYDGINYKGIETVSAGNDSQKSSFAGTFTYEILIENNGRYKITETYNGKPFVSTGTWNFTGNIGDNKNKEQIVLTQNNYEGNSFKGNTIQQTFNIKELRNKKMVLYSHSSSEYNGYSQNQSEEFTFEHK
ncbi:MAG: hypothetical protein ACK50A_13310 [Sphingobacteriaceae bacterium]